MMSELELPMNAPVVPRFTSGKIIVERLMSRASVLTGTNRAELLSDVRSHNVSWVRCAVMAVARERGLKFTRVGELMGGRDHSTIISGVRRATFFEAQDPDFRALINELRKVDFDD